MNGLAEPFASGHLASHIMTVPDTAAIRRPMPAVSATPMPRRPSTNSQWAYQVPAMSWKKPSNGPTSTDRKPLVGLPPLIHAFADGVAYPRPNVLSTNAHRNTNPVA